MVLSRRGDSAAVRGGKLEAIPAVPGNEELLLGPAPPEAALWLRLRRNNSTRLGVDWHPVQGRVVGSSASDLPATTGRALDQEITREAHRLRHHAPPPRFSRLYPNS